ncbi:unnamed protein product [Thelazia callipaeda]|uniref:Fatty-acid and retinol-binding protein 1 n=1 Tax=Thelazia callipaeda TaxID=103827 RepID=A0A0N5D8N3_THECL|nr:unnamed protein product [Thelazia callipaeda]
MYHQVILLGLIASTLASVIPISISNIMEEYKEFAPQEVTNFYNDLTPEDKQILRELASNHASFANEDAVLQAFKEKSEKLYNKAIELRNFVKAKIDSLNTEAKTFVEEVIAKIQMLIPRGQQKFEIEKLKNAIQDIVAKYRLLTEETKEELKLTFPQTTKVISSKFITN